MSNPEFTRKFEGDGYSVMARPNSCFFCDHLTDIVFDYTNGPYMFFCDIHHMEKEDDPDPIEVGMLGECEDFAEREEEIE